MDPVLRSIHILKRGGLSGLDRSGYCQGGLTNQEVERKIALYQENYNLLNNMVSVSTRVNKYLNCDSMSGKMMSKQTRPIRECKEIEKSNLALYLKIVNSKPSVTKTSKLFKKEVDRTHLASMLSNRTGNAQRVKAMANGALYERYGSTGSSNRLI